MEYVAEFQNKGDGITAVVAAGTNYKYNVGIRDDDSGEFVGIWILFNDKANAIAKAKSLVA